MLCYVYHDTFYEDEWDALNAVYENSNTLEEAIGHKISVYDTRHINYGQFTKRPDVVRDINNILDKFTCFLYDDVGEENYNMLTRKEFDQKRIQEIFANAICEVVDPTHWFVMPDNELRSFLTTREHMEVFYDQ